MADDAGSRKLWTGEAIGGYATALALLVSIVTFVKTYNAQEAFNKTQLELQKAAAVEQHAANEDQRLAAEAQRETAAVEALGRYLENPKTPIAWESAEAIIDVLGKDADPAWKATAKRALYRHPENLQRFECELYSDAFKTFVLTLTTTHKMDDLCSGKAHFAPLHS
jgi:hypothetical protein